MIVTVAVALADPLVALIVAVPGDTAVTNPLVDTEATPALDVAHVTGAPEIVTPRTSFTVEVSVLVAPTEVRLTLELLSVMLAAA